MVAREGKVAYKYILRAQCICMHILNTYNNLSPPSICDILEEHYSSYNLRRSDFQFSK